MRLQRYVILRTPRSDSNFPELRSTSDDTFEDQPIRDLRVETVALTRGEANDLARDPTIASYAPTIDFTLHEPLECQLSTEASDATWGVKAVGADQSPYDGRSVTMAILDTGIDRNHAAFHGVAIEEKDFTGEGNGDENGHGTHCAGTVFGQGVANCRIGIALGVKRALIGKVLDKKGRGATDTIMEGLQWAIKEGAHIVSISLGMDFPGYVEQLRESGIPPKSATSLGLAAYRANLGIFDALGVLVRRREALFQPTLVIAATGNESNRPLFTVSSAPPSTAEGTISVNALGEGPGGLTVAPFSNTKGDLSGPGVQILSSRLGGGLRALSGTSMATPHVAGVAALWADSLLRKHGRFGKRTLTAKLIAGCITEPLAPGFDLDDVGAGVVRAPR